MLRRTFVVSVFCCVIACLSAFAQDPCPAAPAALSSKLYCLIPNALHITGAQASFINAPLGIMLGQLPLATPASGFVYTFDKSLGVYTASSESFGPVLTQRAETIGRHKLFVAFTYQHFGFSSVDGNDLTNIPIVATGTESGVNGLIYTQLNNRFDIKADQYAAYATFGLTDRIDVSVAVPFQHVSMGVSLKGNEYFPNGAIVNVPTMFSSGSSSGIGDVVLSAKGTAWKGEHLALALGTELRLPSGDALNFLGSGATGVKPYATLSRQGRIAPHGTVGYQWNADSVLARSCPPQPVSCALPNSGVSHNLPANVFYTAGADLGATKHVTLAVDWLGQRFFNAPRVSTPVPINIPYQSGLSFPSIKIIGETGDFSVDNLSVGAKVNPVGHLLITANVLLKLDDGGLRARAVPLAGLSYTF